MGRRRYHLGLDWGTSATKLVLRDYEQQAGFVLFPDGKPSYRYPSTVVQNGPKLYFGFKAEELRKGAKTFDALKAAIYNGAENTRPAFEEDLATLYLAHVINVGFNFAEQHAARANDEAILGLTLGIPAEELEQSVFRIAYLRMIRTAYEIAVRFECDVQGEDHDDCLTILNLARQKIREKDGQTPPREDLYTQWLRPELAAAMYWSTKSPTLQDGLFSCVDIGAWTTNASYFRINTQTTDGVRERGIYFFGGACRQPGMLELIKSLSRARRKHFSSYLGHEERLFSHLKEADEESVKTFGSEYFSTWRLGFQQAYRMHPLTESWNGKLHVMVVGGGAKVSKIKKVFREFPNASGWTPPIPVPDLGTPADLYKFPEAGIRPTKPFEGDSTFLLVAYGLSVNSRDFPKTRLTPDVQPFEAQSRQRQFNANQCRDCGRPPVLGSDKCYACGG